MPSVSRSSRLDGIPTLTQRAEPTLGPDPARTDAVPRRPDAHPDEDGLPPVLMEPLLAEPPPVQGDPAPAAAATPAAPPSLAGIPEAVLRAALQAEVEQAVKAAVDEAATQLGARLEAELPAIMARALRRVRPG